MKIAITGHTSGLGLALFNHFSKQHEVIGLSRSNGFDISKDRGLIVNIAAECDIFFNNAHSGVYQGLLIQELCNKVATVTSGSMGADYTHLKDRYFHDKHFIEKIYKKISINRTYPMLLLKMGFLENYKDVYSINYQEIIDAVEFWILNPKITLIEFNNKIE